MKDKELEDVVKDDLQVAETCTAAETGAEDRQKTGGDAAT